MRLMGKKIYFLVICLILATVFCVLGSTAPAEKCKAHLEKLGWEVCGGFLEETVILPGSDNPVWQNYLDMQKENGFDMEPYCGKPVLRLSASIGNHMGGSGVQTNVYWADGKIIGGDILSPALDGFMHGLCPREEAVF